jgi:hypothetical protein
MPAAAPEHGGFFLDSSSRNPPERAFVAEAEYRDITSEGLLRQSSFKGLQG